MATESPYPAPFDAATFLFPAEWQGLAEAFGGLATGLLFLHDGQIVHLNNNLEEQLGFSEAELIGQPIESLLLPEEKSDFRADSADGAQGRRIRLASKSGKPVEFHLILNRIDTLSNGRYTIWVLQPPSRQAAVQAASENAAATARREAIAVHLPALVLVCAPDGMLSYASHAFAALVGREDSEAQHLHLSEVVHHDDRSRLFAALQRLAAHAGAPSTLSFRVRHHNGAWRHIEAQASNLLAQPEVAGLLLSGCDRTEQMVQQHHMERHKERQLHYLNRLLHIAQRPHPDLASALKVILKASAKALGTHRCAYWETANDDPAALRCVLAYDDVAQNVVDDVPEPRFATALHPLLRLTSSSERALAVGDVDQDPRTALSCEYFHSEGIKAVMIVPVRRPGSANGLLMLSHFGQARVWRRDEADFAVNVSGLMSRVFNDIERTRTASQLRGLAHQGSMAGKADRHLAIDEANALFPKAAENATPLAAFFIGIDGIKRSGEPADNILSDELRKAAAHRLKGVVRKDDIVLQLDGKEFMLLARRLADRRIEDDIARQIMETMQDPFLLHGEELHITARIGIAHYPQDGTDVETLTQKADSALLPSESTSRHPHRMLADRAPGNTDSSRP